MRRTLKGTRLARSRTVRHPSPRGSNHALKPALPRTPYLGYRAPFELDADQFNWPSGGGRSVRLGVTAFEIAHARSALTCCRPKPDDAVGGMAMEHSVLPRPIGDADDPYGVVLELHAVVVRIHFDGVRSLDHVFVGRGARWTATEGRFREVHRSVGRSRLTCGCCSRGSERVGRGHSPCGLHPKGTRLPPSRSAKPLGGTTDHHCRLGRKP